jgi:hypothetical protein
LDITDTNHVTVWSSTGNQKSYYSNYLSDYDAKWYIPKNGLGAGEAIPQRAWICSTF